MKWPQSCLYRGAPQGTVITVAIAHTSASPARTRMCARVRMQSEPS